MSHTQSASGLSAAGARCIALVGPFQSGKTTLLEAILSRTGAIARQGSVDAGNTVGDSSKEAREHKMSVELSFAETTFMGDAYTFIDCPGSVEFMHETRAAVPVADAAVVVCELDEKKLPQLQIILRDLEDRGIPHLLFLNKIDKADAAVLDALRTLQQVSRTRLVMRQLPTFSSGIISGFVDLALERAFVYREAAPSEVVPLDEALRDSEQSARFSMLETLADHDDELMEQLLGDIQPPQDKVFDDLSRDLRDGRVSPVLLGAASRTNGVLRLLKALRHEVPSVKQTAVRLGASGGDPLAVVIKTQHTTHGGKLSVARMLNGEAGDGAVFVTSEGNAGRVSGVFKLMGAQIEKRGAAKAGDTVAFGKLEHASTGQTLTAGKTAHAPLIRLEPEPPVLAITLAARDRKDDVKLGLALTKLTDEDPSLVIVQNPEAHEIVLWGQGDMHLRVATEKLRDRFGIAIEAGKPSVGYRETIRKPIQIRGRHRKQSGGHGQYGDVVVDIKPLARGSGFQFEDKITGGVVPRNYIPSVEEGVADGLRHGPLGFPVVDVAVALVDGSYHAVDSSDQAFRTAGRLAISEALPQCQPVLLEPIQRVEIACPSEAAARMNAILSGRRAQILGFDTRDGWDGWDVVRALVPEAEIGNLIVEVRSATAGVGSFKTTFDHLAEVAGRAAEQVLHARKSAA